MNSPVSSKTFVIVVVVSLLASNAFFAAQYASAQRQLTEIQRQLEAQRINERMLAFTQLFIEKVLKSEGEIDFETRLQLVNAVRDIGDEEILAQWQRFTESTNEKEAQQEVKNLLSLLLRKVGM